MFQDTTQTNSYAFGDCTRAVRSGANAVSIGNITGALVNIERIEAKF